MYQTASMAAAAPLLGDITAFSAVVPTTQFSFDGGLTYNTVSNILTDSTLLSQLQGSNIGIYQVGFFPTMMFGLPAVAIAMACRAEQEHRKQV
jgi:phosphotransferase system  glucose/maltose/N-acetylglucosamine-specific IIC component